MTIFYSSETNGFYATDKHGSAIPGDAIEISQEEHTALLQGQINGKIIKADENGRPVLIDPHPSTPAEIEAAKVQTVQAHMDAAAQALGYDDIKTACTYAEEPAVPKFQAEGRAFRVWRSLVWEKCYEILEEVKRGARDIPSDDEIISMLPKFLLPS